MPLVNDRTAAIRRLDQPGLAVAEPTRIPEWCSCCPRPLPLEHSHMSAVRPLVHETSQQQTALWRLRCSDGMGGIAFDKSAEIQLPPTAELQWPVERNKNLKLRAADLWKGVRHTVLNHAAKNIQAKWRVHTSRKRAASKIQRLWRNRSQSSMSSDSRQRYDTASFSRGRVTTCDCSAEKERSMRHSRRRRRTTFSEAVNVAASRIQKLWRHRGRAVSSSSSSRSVRCSSTMTDATLQEDVEAVAEEPFKKAFSMPPLENSSSSAIVLVDPASSAGAAPLLRAWWEDRKKRALEHLVLETAGPVLKRRLQDIGDVVKTSVTSDPDMWRCVRPVAHTAMSELWNDIQLEIESRIKDAVLESQEALDVAPEATGCCCCLLLRLRSWVLFHYLPYNRSIYGKLADPIYVFMTLSTMLPVFGIRVFFFSAILIMLLFPGPPDEYQLINFILIFKGTQFFTVGVAMMFIGAMRYYACYLFDGGDLRGCIDTNGPGSSDWLSSEIFDYVGSIVLVWIAFLALPLSSVHLSGHRKTSEHEVKVYCCCLRGVPTRGGRLRWLLRYDIVAFALSVAAYVPIYIMKSAESQDEHRMHQPQVPLVHAKETVYWCRILYSLLSLPFVLFTVPLCGRVLTRSVYTGYNEFGACVTFRYREPAAADGKLP